MGIANSTLSRLSALRKQRWAGGNFNKVLIDDDSVSDSW